MLKFINDILVSFRECFSRKATFGWFVVIVCGIIVATDHLGVTSIMRGLLLVPHHYDNLIGFFRSGGWNLESLFSTWCKIVEQTAPLYKHNGRIILIADGVKQSKEGRRMPGVKRHRQESGNASKSDYIWGHLFGSVGVIIEKEGKRFCLPLIQMIQDGVKRITSWGADAGSAERQDSHVVESIKLAYRASTRFCSNAILLLDAYYLSVPALEKLEELNLSGKILHIVTRAKSNCRAYEIPKPNTGNRGRPRKKGESVKLINLFETMKEKFVSATVMLYDKQQEVRYCCVDLLWGKQLYKLLRFVLIEYNGTKTILVTTDLTMNPLDVILLYGKRFTIESMFREMKQVVYAFCYRFWSKHMPKLNRYKKKTEPDLTEKITDEKSQKRIQLALKAIEGFVFCACTSIGILQMTALHFSGTSEFDKLRYMRTVRNAVPSEATTADLINKKFFYLLQKQPDLDISQIISEKQVDFVADIDTFDAA